MEAEAPERRKEHRWPGGGPTAGNRGQNQEEGGTGEAYRHQDKSRGKICRPHLQTPFLSLFLASLSLSFSRSSLLSLSHSLSSLSCSLPLSLSPSFSCSFPFTLSFSPSLPLSPTFHVFMALAPSPCLRVQVSGNWASCFFIRRRNLTPGYFNLSFLKPVSDIHS